MGIDLGKYKVFHDEQLKKPCFYGIFYDEITAG